MVTCWKKVGKPKNLVLGYNICSDAHSGGNANISFLWTNLNYIIPEGQLYSQPERYISCPESDGTHIKSHKFYLRTFHNK